MFTVAGYLYNGTPDSLAIDQQAWDDTGDVRFAEALFISKELKHDLRLDDPGLAAALKKFPDGAILAGVVVRLTAQAGQPLEGPLTERDQGRIHEVLARPAPSGSGFAAPRRRAAAAVFPDAGEDPGYQIGEINQASIRHPVSTPSGRNISCPRFQAHRYQLAALGAAGVQLALKAPRIVADPAGFMIAPTDPEGSTNH